MRPRMKGKEIPTRPAIAIGSFSSSDILSVLLHHVETENVSISFKPDIDPEDGANPCHYPYV